METPPKNEFNLLNLQTLAVSKKTWKTYKGAGKHAGPEDIVTTAEGAKWALRNPDWCKTRLAASQSKPN